MKRLTAHKQQNLVLVGREGVGDDTAPTPSSFLNWLINTASLLHHLQGTFNIGTHYLHRCMKHSLGAYQQTFM
jgi:hypothetical protein